MRNLRHLVQLVEGCDEEYMRFELDYNTLLVLTASTARAATPAILETHSIPQRASADLEDALRGAPAPQRKPAAAAGAKRKGAPEASVEGSPMQPAQEAAPPPPPRRRR